MIERVIADFVESWKLYMDKEEGINSGDCGLTAIALYWVLKHRGVDVDIVMNDAHCWIRKDGVDYDTVYPKGYTEPVGELWPSVNPETLLTLEAAAEEWMPCDALGGYLLRGFFRRYNLDMPECLQHCIDNAAEYDNPAFIPHFEERSDRVRKRVEGFIFDGIGNQEATAGDITLTIGVHGDNLSLTQPGDDEEDLIDTESTEQIRQLIAKLQAYIDVRDSATE